MRRVISILVCGTLFLAGCARHAETKVPGPGPFDITNAMRILFGNYDSVLKASLYRVPQGTVQDPNFVDKNEIRARSFFVQDTTENGVHKYYVLTWAKPAGQPFDCQGCAPLI